ncbi:MAG: RNA methyltransferase [Rhodothermales bacterium]
MRTETHLSARLKKEIASLALKKYRDQLGIMLIEGLRSVEAAVEAKAPIRAFVVTEEMRSDPEVERIFRGSETPVYIASAAEMKALSDVESSPGIVAVVEIETVPAAELHGLARILALDGLQDPGNAGTIVRAAAWFGIDAIVSGPGTVDLYNPKVVRSAMGGLWDVRQAVSEDLASTLEEMRSAGYVIYGADVEGTSIDRWQPTVRSVLVLGNEAHGLSSVVRRVVNERIVVPGSPGRKATESLNVGVAAGILMYEWTKNTQSPERRRG